MLLAVLSLILLLGWMRRARWGSVKPTYAAAGAGHLGALRSYRPENIGNDASARPWEYPSFQPPALPQTQPPGESAPPGFDAANFLIQVEHSFLQLQATANQADLAPLRALLTADMLAEMQSRLNERSAQTGAAASPTQVHVLHAKLLGVQERERDYLASVEFFGLMTQAASAGPSPFREIWNLTQPKDASTGWLVAGIQALH